uniref:Uncharacterized protein n=1 Tax=Sphaerodactylus townsendi TaxID=933632 RepID=A0ACB8FY04_9SAUR
MKDTGQRSNHTHTWTCHTDGTPDIFLPCAREKMGLELPEDKALWHERGSVLRRHNTQHLKQTPPHPARQRLFKVAAVTSQMKDFTAAMAEMPETLLQPSSF